MKHLSSSSGSSGRTCFSRSAFSVPLQIRRWARAPSPGPKTLTPSAKREAMGIMQMKREMLRLGAYAREYFVSRTQLTQMADVAINVAAQASDTLPSARAPVA